MGTNNIYNNLSEKTKSLLKSGESEIVDYKLNVTGVKAEDLVAFANSLEGGTLLIGVEENNETNVQTGVVVGCDTSDKSKLKITSKALSCTPAVSLKIIVENLDFKPILRISIPSGEQKPYCTENGTYKVRKDDRNSSLKPNDLLNIYLQKEAEIFNQRFKEASDDVLDGLNKLLIIIDGMEDTIISKVRDMASTLEWTEMEASDAKSTIEYVNDYVLDIQKRLKKSNKRILTIVNHLEAKDPIRKDFKNEIASELYTKAKQDPSIYDLIMKRELTYEAKNDEIRLTNEEKKEVIDSIIKHINEESE